MSAELVFYTNPQSRGRMVRWMLEEVGAPYRTEVLAYGTTMKTAQYLSLNPMGKVPAIRHGDQVVTETAAICAYLADAFPQAELAPPPSLRGAYYRWLFFAAGPLEAAVTNRSLGVEVPTDKQGFVGYGTYDTVVHTLSHAVMANPFIAGEHFSAADVYIASHIGWGMQWGTLPKRPEFEAYCARATDRDARRRASELDDALVAKG
jgi:glutathione S-transferase